MKPEFNPNVKLAIDPAKLEKIILGLRAGDISECLVSDVKHADEVLTYIAFLARIAPGFMDELLAIFTPHFIAQHKRAIIGELAQQRADAEGFGQEWREAIEAGRSPNQKDFLAKMVGVYMKAEGVNQNQAIKAAAEQLGRDEGNIRRVVIRSKHRPKKK